MDDRSAVFLPWCVVTAIDDHSLRTLMRSAQSGDRAAYRTLLDNCRQWLEGYYARRMPPHQIDDLVQDTLISLHRKRASYDPERPFLPWLSVIARYRWIDALRRMPQSEELMEQHGLVPDESSAVHARLSLERLLERLPKAQASAITLTKIEGCSVAETAEISGQSESAVKVNVHRGLKTLARHIESE